MASFLKFSLQCDLCYLSPPWPSSPAAPTKICHRPCIPPIAQNEPPVLLPRDQRQPGVFIGFDDVSASYFYIRTDDRMTNDGNDHYVRRAIVEKIGVSYR